MKRSRFSEEYGHLGGASGQPVVSGAILQAKQFSRGGKSHYFAYTHFDDRLTEPFDSAGEFIALSGCSHTNARVLLLRQWLPQTQTPSQEEVAQEIANCRVAAIETDQGSAI